MRKNATILTAPWLCLTLLVAAQAWRQEQQTLVDPYSIRITAVLADKGGSPVKGKRVWAYPVNAKGDAVIVRTMPPGYVFKVWNPVTQTDSAGKFVLQMPLITRIDNSPIAEVVIGIGDPAGGLSVRSRKGIEYADPKRQIEDCLTMSVSQDQLSLLRKGTEIIRIKIGEKNRETDLGKIVFE